MKEAAADGLGATVDIEAIELPADVLASCAEEHYTDLKIFMYEVGRLDPAHLRGFHRFALEDFSVASAVAEVAEATLDGREIDEVDWVTTEAREEVGIRLMRLSPRLSSEVPEERQAALTEALIRKRWTKAQLLIVEHLL